MRRTVAGGDRESAERGVGQQAVLSLSDLFGQFGAADTQSHRHRDHEPTAAGPRSQLDHQG